MRRGRSRLADAPRAGAVVAGALARAAAPTAPPFALEYPEVSKP